MSKPRYAIVRVTCPFIQEKFDFSSCSKMFNCDKFIRCEKCEHNCRYGDTKEQLVAKVAQAIRIISKELNHSNITMTEKQIFETTAKFVVEFLGVEE